MVNIEMQREKPMKYLMFLSLIVASISSFAWADSYKIGIQCGLNEFYDGTISIPTRFEQWGFDCHENTPYPAEATLAPPTGTYIEISGQRYNLATISLKGSISSPSCGYVSHLGFFDFKGSV